MHRRRRRKLNYDMEMLDNLKDVYHVCSEGLKTCVLFENDRDFIDGMNAVAICSQTSSAKILCFCLMDNHVHFILTGTYAESKRFILKYKTLLAKWKGGLKEDMKISIKPINDNNHLLNSIAYVIRNPIAAGYPHMPDEYRWASSDLYFKSSPHTTEYNRQAADMTQRQLQQELHTRHKLPDSWTLNGNGMIWPGHYVDYKLVDRMFHSPKRFLYYLSVTQDKVLMEPAPEHDAAFIRDKELRKLAATQSEKTFGTSEFNSLHAKDRLTLAKLLRRQYGSTNMQLARILHLEIRDFI